MAKETVQAVRQVELNAVQKEKEAQDRNEAIISEAEQSAKSIMTSMTKQAMERAELDLSIAKQKGDKIIEAMKLKAEDEAILLKDKAGKKEKAAIDLIISYVINEG